uniref:Uncharacterized protein n=1 Tax=Oryza barthii TaxID=65489 RepID=A0A0D3EPM1_9ORYZ
MENAEGIHNQGLTLIKKMVEQTKHSTKGLLVVFLVLLGCFAIPGHEGYFCCFNTRSRHNGQCYSTVSDCLPNCFQIL